MVQYGYDPAGQVSMVTRGGMGYPLTTAVTYDGAGQVSSLVHASGATVLEGYDITRNVLGSPTEVTTTTGGATTSALYTYDVVGRLRTECYPASGEVCSSRSPRMVYSYDRVGNRLSDAVRTVSGTRATTVVTDYAYDVADQLLTQSVGGAPTVTNTWTLNGALASSTTPEGTQTFATDLTDELISLELADGSTVGYTHDAQGNRTSRTVDGVLDASWVWDELSSLPVRVGEYDASGTVTTAWLPDPASATGSPLVQTSGGSSSWLLSDPFLNTVASVSTSGTTLSGTRDLNAFGVPITPATGSLADAATGFAGQYLDDATGLYDMRARDYDPSSGRFTATDPVAVPTGTAYFSGYTYGYNNPLVYSDASGLWPDWGQTLKVAAAPYIAAGQLVYGIGHSMTPQGQAKLAVSVAVTYEQSGGGWGGAWTSANVHFNPIYGAVEQGFSAYDDFRAGNYGDGMIHVYSAVDITAATAFGARAALRSGCKTFTATTSASSALAKGLARAEIEVNGTKYTYGDRVIARAAEDPGPMHNFPAMFDETIIRDGTRDVTPSGWTQYTLEGNVNGKAGNYEIGGWPSAAGDAMEIDHRVFRPSK